MIGVRRASRSLRFFPLPFRPFTRSFSGGILLSSSVPDQVFSALSSCGGVRVTVCSVPSLLSLQCTRHRLSPLASRALSDATVCSLLLASGLKDGSAFQLALHGDGPLQSVLAVADSELNSRACVGEPEADGETLGELLGEGTVQVVKSHPKWGRLYNGVTVLEGGDVFKSVNNYLERSEQRECLIGGAFVPNFSSSSSSSASSSSESPALEGCLAACGILVERLPDCKPSSMSIALSNSARLLSPASGSSTLLSNQFLGGSTCHEVLSEALSGLGLNAMGSPRAPTLRCDCGPDKVLSAMALLPEEDLEDVIRGLENVESKCQFCATVHSISVEKVRASIVSKRK